MVDAWNERNRIAKEIWTRGATTAEVAAALDLSVDGARRNIRRWLEQDNWNLFGQGRAILADAGFTPLQIAIVMRENYLLTIHRAEIDRARRAQAPEGTR